MSTLHPIYSQPVILEMNNVPLSHKLCPSRAFQMRYAGTKFNTKGKEKEEGEERGEDIQLLLLYSGHVPTALLSH